MASGALVAVVLAAATWGCAGRPSSFRGGLGEIERGSRLAVLPLVNLTQDQSAPDVVMNSLIVQVLDTGMFTVVDPGLVQSLVVDKRLRLTDRLSLQALSEIESDLGATYVMQGTVNDFGLIQEAGDAQPTVSVSLRIVACRDGRIVWAASHARRGDDRESVFGLGRIGTLEQLTQVTVGELMETLRPPAQ